MFTPSDLADALVKMGYDRLDIIDALVKRTDIDEEAAARVTDEKLDAQAVEAARLDQLQAADQQQQRRTEQ
jgi:hypothetical protein